METEDLIKLPASSSSGSENENDRADDSVCGPAGGDSASPNFDTREDGEIGNTDEIENAVNGDDKGLRSEFDEDMDISPTSSPVRAGLTESIEVKEKVTILSSEIHAENGFTNVEGHGLSNQQEDVPVASHQGTNATTLSGVKRPRSTVDEQQGSVRVTYDSLTRESRQKLEELLQSWSQWHTRHCLSSNASGEALESGERTYFPALHVGLNKASTVSFWMDEQTQTPPSKQFIPLDGKSVPLYDRGYSLALASTDGSSNQERGFEVLDDSRCFNCGSYGHALKDCPKPRDNVAVNNARKQHKSKRNQNASSRNATRYYQNSPKGKFDGLKPGVLDAETRRLLGLAELDPPPWLSRMREMGYPPGYLDPEEDEDQPSGITIFADEEPKETKQETEEGEILDVNQPDPPPKKMSVEFPGINAPIPDNADKRRWEAGSSTSNYHSRNHSHRRYEYPPESITSSRSYHYEQMRSRDYLDDGPPGVDPKSSPSWSSYSHRYGSYDSGYVIRSPPPGWRSPSYGRSLSDREDRSSNYGVYGSL